ncbi:MAG: dihydrodipicolinate synthase family protein [Candidatus Bathyarchaeia archaeon]
MAKTKILEGIFPLTPFPLKKNQEVDYEAIRENIQYLIENGFPGFIAFGSMGSHHAPSEEQFNKVTDVSVDAANGKIACVIGTSALCAREAIRRTKYAEDAGADAVMPLVPGYGFPVTREVAAKFWQLLNDAIKGDMAIMIYNEPNFTGFNHDATFWEQVLLKLEHVKAVKEGATEPDDILLKIADKINVFSFTEGQFWRLSMLGAKGIVAQWSWMAPKVFQKFYKMCREGKWFDPWVLKVYKLLPAPGYGFDTIGVKMKDYVQGILHAMVDIAGCKGGEVALPYLPVPETSRRLIEEKANKLRALE